MSVDMELAERMVAALNDMLEHDRNAIDCLIANRVPCNAAMADHPTVQVSAQNCGFSVGMLGVLNGLCGVYDDGPKEGYGAIGYVFDDDPNPKKHATLSRFEIVKNE